MTLELICKKAYESILINNVMLDQIYLNKIIRWNSSDWRNKKNIQKMVKIKFVLLLTTFTFQAQGELSAWLPGPRSGLRSWPLRTAARASMAFRIPNQECGKFRWILTQNSALGYGSIVNKIGAGDYVDFKRSVRSQSGKANIITTYQVSVGRRRVGPRPRQPPSKMYRKLSFQ